jgi:hypothetical protein
VQNGWIVANHFAFFGSVKVFIWPRISLIVIVIVLLGLALTVAVWCGIFFSLTYPEVIHFVDRLLHFCCCLVVLSFCYLSMAFADANNIIAITYCTVQLICVMVMYQ